MSRRLFFWLFFTAALLASCHKTRVTPVASGHHVFAVGWTQTSGNPQIATMWKDGVQSYLSSPVGGSGQGAVAAAVTTVGTDVYIAGYIYNAKDTNAVYWKNGTATVLGLGRGLAIAVSGTTVYVAGVDGTYGHVCYWKNGAQTVLGSNVATTWVQAMALEGSDLFIGGSIDTLGAALACYWMNGSPAILGHNYVTSSAAWGIAISGQDIYFGGEADDRLNVPAASACYWKNGNLVAMPHPLTGFTAGDCSARAIAVAGTDVYLAGTAWITAGSSLILAPVYWKDSVPTLLDTAGVETSGTNAIAVDSPSLYVGGWYQRWGGPDSQPALWKNGQQLLGGDLVGAVNGIAILK